MIKPQLLTSHGADGAGRMYESGCNHDVIHAQCGPLEYLADVYDALDHAGAVRIDKDYFHEVNLVSRPGSFCCINSDDDVFLRCFGALFHESKLLMLSES
jgi:hypothetical protein